jgi:hypothetical protein
VAAALALDLLALVVTGHASPLWPWAAVGPWGFGLRAALLGTALVLRCRVFAEPARRLSRARLALVLLLLPALLQFQYAGGRMGGDGVMYYVYVRSAWKDLDLDFTNEYTHYELIRRGDLAVTTKTGLRRSIFSIGPALAWTPFFALGEGVARLERLVTGAGDLSGYGPCHRNAVALGSLLLGFGAVLLIHDLLRRHFRPGSALGAALLAWLATFLHWYMVQQPTMSHAPSAFGAALALWLWERGRDGRSPWRWFVLGLALGVAMCLRWQNGVLLVLPGLELVARLARERARWARTLACAGLLAAGTALGAFPQLSAWKALYGEWLLRYPPHGADFLRLDHPWVLETLFSSRHGLLSWTPVFWGAYLGFLPLLRRRPQLGWPLLAPLVLMTYVNACSGDWWAGGSFSNRRFDSLLPVLAFGLAAALDAARRLAAAAPGLTLAVAVGGASLWNLALVEQVRRGLVPRDDTVAFGDLVGNAAHVFAERFGSPTTWPASWLFAWRTGRPPSQYDLLVGRYLFYRQNNLGGHVEVGAPGDDALLGEGWAALETRDGAGCRRVKGRARLFAPLDVPEDLAIRFRLLAAAPISVEVLVNGRVAGRVSAGTTWGVASLRVAAPFWKRELNELALESEGEVCVDAVDFERTGPRPGRRAGA